MLKTVQKIEFMAKAVNDELDKLRNELKGKYCKIGGFVAEIQAVSVAYDAEVNVSVHIPDQQTYKTFSIHSLRTVYDTKPTK